MKCSFILSASGWMHKEYYNPYETCLPDIRNALRDLGIPYDITAPGDSEYSYLADETEGTERYTMWSRIQDLTASGIVDKSQMKELCQSIGAYPTETPTMGSLGGPLGLGIVWDIDLGVESSSVIVSLRVTPVPERKGQMIEYWPEERIENMVNRLERAFISVFKDL